MNANVLDIVFVGLMASFGLLSVMRGAVRELLSLVGLIGGFILAHWFYVDLSTMMLPMLPDPALAELASFLAIFLVGYFLGIFLSGLGGALRPHSHDLVNRGLGGLIGVAKGVVISLVLFWVINSYFPPFQDELRDSFVGRELARLFAMLQDFNLI